jgi:two-component sensor histidine kinase
LATARLPYDFPRRAKSAKFRLCDTSETSMRLDTIPEPAGTTTVLPPETMRRQEVDHRVANSLQLISSLLSLQARQAADVSVRDALGIAAHRIDAVGAIHKCLHQSGSLSSIDIAAYLFDLAETIEQSFGGAGCKRILAHVQSQMVSPDFASALGIMVTELVINACKHAYAPGEAGDIEVRLSFPSRTQFRLEVRDFGGRYNHRAKAGPPGLGTTIIHAMCCKLDATFTYLANPAGTRFLAGGVVR